jgi:hypothetical protein
MSVFAVASLGCGESSDADFPEPDVEPWSKAFGGQASTSQAAAITTGVSGNIALTGPFSGTINFGAGDLVANAQPSFYIAKLTAAGEHVWSGRTGGGNDTTTSLAFDRGGSTLVTGFFDGELDLGTGLLSGDDNLFLARFGATGAPVWSRQVGDPFAYDAANDIAVSTADGSMHLTGRAGGTADFGAGPIAESLFATMFVAKLTGSSGALWSRGFGSDGYADGQRIAIDKEGNTIVAGEFSGALNLGGGTLGSFDSFGVFVMKLDANGGHVWSKGYTTYNNLQLSDVAVDPNGGVVVAGNFAGAVDFGGGELVSQGFNDVFFVKLSAGGEHVFSKRFGEVDSYPRTASVAADSAGNLYLGGSFDKTIDFGGGGLVSMGADDVFWAKFTNDGAMMESRSFGDSTSQSLSAMAVDMWGNTVVAGTFYGSVDFGSGRLDAGDQQKLFLARF